MLPERLVFCGGGTRCLVFLQALIELEAAGMLANVREYWGTSAGAFLATLLALKAPVVTVKSLMFQTEYTRFRDMDIGNLLNFTNTWGLDDGASLMRELERVLELLRPGASMLTLKDISGLHIVVSDINIQSAIVLHGGNYAGLRVVEAIRASMSLPIFFRPYVHPELKHYWVDGGLHANFPWDLLPNDTERHRSLGFNFDKRRTSPPSSITEYILSMIHVDEAKKGELYHAEWPLNVLLFPSPPFPAWFMRLQKTDFALVETIGSEVARAWITQVQSSKTPQIPPLSAGPQTPSLSHPARHTTELLGIPEYSSSQPRESASPRAPSSQLVSRRWSV
jgi:predicted acylesterase/phospholipase RssA